MSWLRSLDAGFDRDVDFHYSVRSPADAVYRDEIQAIAAHHPRSASTSATQRATGR